MEAIPASAIKPTVDNTVLLEWTSPSRPYKRRSKEFFKTAGAIVFLISVILIFAGEFLLIGAIAATFFVVYALSAVPPEEIRHRITTLGIESAGYFHRWEELYEFWFDERYGQAIVVIRTLLGFPTHLHILLGNTPADKIKPLLADKIPFREQPERTFLDNASSWIIKKIPLESTS